MTDKNMVLQCQHGQRWFVWTFALFESYIMQPLCCVSLMLHKHPDMARTLEPDTSRNWPFLGPSAGSEAVRTHGADRRAVPAAPARPARCGGAARLHPRPAPRPPRAGQAADAAAGGRRPGVLCWQTLTVNHEAIILTVSDPVKPSQASILGDTCTVDRVCLCCLSSLRSPSYAQTRGRQPRKLTSCRTQAAGFCLMIVPFTAQLGFSNSPRLEVNGMLGWIAWLGCRPQLRAFSTDS